VAVELPGRGGRFREPLVRSFEPLVRDLTAAIRDTCGPSGEAPRRLVLFGHSMGATLAFECARRLTAAGEPPAALVLSSRLLHARPPELHTKSDAELVATLRALGGTPAAVLDNPELLEMMLPIVRADSEMLATYSYVPGPRLVTRLLAVTGQDDLIAPRGEMPAWAEVTEAETQLTILPGGHFYWTEPDALHDAIRAFLAERP
jgi:pyochelin biosynthetic protein PchC